MQKQDAQGSTAGSTADQPAGLSPGAIKSRHFRARIKRRRPNKPYPDFPLYAHAAGQWCKTIRGRDHYFGPWQEPHEALERYLSVRDYLHGGVPLPPATGHTLDELVNRFLADRRARLEAGEISPRQYADYKRDGALLLEHLGRTPPAGGLRPADYARLRAAIATGVKGSRNATTICNIMIRMRSIFKWGHTAGMLAEPPNYGGAFALPSARLRRRALRTNGPKDLQAAEIRKLLEHAKAAAWGQLDNLWAMILLGINCGLGNTDCAELRRGHVDLKAGWLEFERPKTDAPRRARLWPETVAAIRAALKRQAAMIERDGPLPPELAGRVFVTKRRRPYVALSPAGKPVDSVGLEFGRLARACGVHRRGIGFYSLRHTFQTVADNTRDFPAIDLVMGHVPDDGGGSAPFAVKMSARYRERIADERLKAVSQYVRTWLFKVSSRSPDRPTRRRPPGRKSTTPR